MHYNLCLVWSPHPHPITHRIDEAQGKEVVQDFQISAHYHIPLVTSHHSMRHLHPSPLAHSIDEAQGVQVVQDINQACSDVPRSNI